MLSVNMNFKCKCSVLREIVREIHIGLREHGRSFLFSFFFFFSSLSKRSPIVSLGYQSRWDYIEMTFKEESICWIHLFSQNNDP